MDTSMYGWVPSTETVTTLLTAYTSQYKVLKKKFFFLSNPFPPTAGFWSASSIFSVNG